MNENDVQGWFNYPDLLDFVAERVPQHRAHLVELGPWLGRGTIHLGKALQRLGKQSAIISSIDTWEGTHARGEDQYYDHLIAAMSGPPWEVFWRHMVEFGLDGIVVPIQQDSIIAADDFADNSLDFVFHDTDHSYDHVHREIRAWHPKVKPGSVYGGHDYGWEGVYKAVNELVPNVKTMGPCWWAIK